MLTNNELSIKEITEIMNRFEEILNFIDKYKEVFNNYEIIANDLISKIKKEN